MRIIGEHLRFALLVPIAFVLSCQARVESNSVSLPKQADTKAPVAKVGKYDLYKDEIPALARMALSLRSNTPLAADVTIAPTDELALALEPLLLACVVGVGPEQLDTEAREEYKRLLVRIFLERTVAAVGEGQISEEEIQHAHQTEMEQYQKTGASELFVPARVDATVVMVGLVPDMHVPVPGEVPVVDRATALALARQFRDTLGDRVYDLDQFLTRAREFSSGHPTVQTLPSFGITLDARFANMESRQHAALVALDGNGAVSEPIEFDGGVSVIRRGYTTPGRGERIEDIRPQLEANVRDLRRQEAFQKLRKTLYERYYIQTWPERISADRGDQSKP